MTVQIFSWNSRVGEIVWDGEKFTTSGKLTSIVNDPIRLRGSGRVIESKDEPELFMRSLNLMYDGAYLRASQAVES
jgi:hypothetical protein